MTWAVQRPAPGGITRAGATRPAAGVIALAGFEDEELTGVKGYAVGWAFDRAFDGGGRTLPAPGRTRRGATRLKKKRDTP